MSCTCGCGCDNKYSGGTQCYPLIVKISHPININYTCEAFNVNHPSSPEVNLLNTENCNQITSLKEDKDEIRTLTYYFALAVNSGSGCSNGESYERATIKFTVTPPMRGWHNKGDGEDEPPYTKYDDTNPSCYIKCKARWKSSSDVNMFSFEAYSNPDTNSHLGNPSNTHEIPPDVRKTLVVEILGGDVSVKFQQADDD